MKLGTWLE